MFYSCFHFLSVHSQVLVVEVDAAEAVSGSSCQACGREFDSRTKLFEHLKKNPKHVTLK